MLRKITSRRPVAYRPHAHVPDYLNCYVVESLECGHVKHTFWQCDPLIALHRNCTACDPEPTRKNSESQKGKDAMTFPRSTAHRHYKPTETEAHDQAITDFTRVTTDMLMALSHCREMLDRLEEQIQKMPPPFRADPAAGRARASIAELRQEVAAAIDNAEKLFKSVPFPQ